MSRFDRLARAATMFFGDSSPRRLPVRLPHARLVVMRRFFALVVIGGVLAGCSGGGGRPDAKPVPIRTEAPVVESVLPSGVASSGVVLSVPPGVASSGVVSSGVVSSTSPARSSSPSPDLPAPAADSPTTTLVVAATSGVPATFGVPATSGVPQPTPLTYRQPVLIRFEPTTDDERMLIEVAKELIPKKVLIDNRLETDRKVLEEVYQGAMVDKVLTIDLRDQGAVIVPGEIDRTVLTAARVEGDRAIFELCDANNASTYALDKDGLLVPDGQPGFPETYLETWTLSETPGGWRIESIDRPSYFAGEDRCAS